MLIKLIACVLSVKSVIPYGGQVLPGPYNPGTGCLLRIKEVQCTANRLAAPVSRFRRFHAGSTWGIVDGAIRYRAELRNAAGIFKDNIINGIGEAG